jgi:NitT/TauT family transport system ATP-binding protein
MSTIAAPAAETRCGVPIAIRSAAKVFGEDSDQPFRALKEVSVDIAAGEFVSVVGPSGCGKSTLMLMVAGLLERSQGDITIDGRSVTGARHRRRHRIPGSPAPRLPYGAPQRDAACGHPEAAEEADRGARAGALRPAPALTGGGQVSASALGRHAAARFTDPHAGPRPVAPLDGRAVRRARRADTGCKVRTDLEALWLKRRPTVLFITHSVEEAVGLSDRILVMSPSPGEVIEEIRVDIPRPRPIVLGDVPEFAVYVDRIHRHFERLGVLHGFNAVTH